MEDIIKKLEDIRNEFLSLNNPTNEEINNLKQREFDLFGDISKIGELIEYYVTDMTISGLGNEFIQGMSSGVVNGSMFVISSLRNIINSDEKDADKLREMIRMKIDEISGIV